MASKLNKSWERTRIDTHSPVGIEELRKNVKWGLMRFYMGIAESMWRYDFGPGFEDMQVMSRDKVPEKFLMNNGEAVIFRDDLTGQCHILPFVMDSGAINMYGEAQQWSPVPVGWVDSLKGTGSPIERIRNLKLDATNSVIIRNDLFSGNDKAYIESVVNELVDNQMTMNQLQLIAKCPFIFNVSEDNLVSAKNFFLAICQDKPVIFTNAGGDRLIPSIETTQMKIDPSLFELFDRFECQILTYIGFPCVPITKRAQQTVSEVQSNDSKLYARRMEKFHQRQKACERVASVLGASMVVHSVIDEDIAEMSRNVSEGSENGA